MFIACHPVLSTEARVALTLRLLGGLTTDEIARAFLVPEPTIAQRIVRAKRTLAEDARAVRGAARRPSWPARLASVLEVIYLVFNEGYSATAGDDWMRPALCDDALRLGRMLAELVPAGARGARAGRADGDPGVALRARASDPTASRSCCSIRIARAGISCSSAAASPRSSAPSALGGARRLVRAAGRRSPPATRARRTADDTDWARIAALYAALAALTPSPVVELNRAVAVGDGRRPGGGPGARRRLAGEPALRSYHLLPSVRGDLLDEARAPDEARAEFERAAALTRNARERALLLERARCLRQLATRGKASCRADR